MPHEARQSAIARWTTHVSCFRALCTFIRVNQNTLNRKYPKYVAYKVLRNNFTKNIQYKVCQLLWYVVLMKYQNHVTYVSCTLF